MYSSKSRYLKGLEHVQRGSVRITYAVKLEEPHERKQRGHRGHHGIIITLVNETPRNGVFLASGRNGPPGRKRAGSQRGRGRQG